MSLDAQLQALTLPEGTEFPGTPQELLDLIAQYMEITGLNPFNGINYGASTPSPSNRDRPWFKTTVSGVPIGWFSWDGSAWQKIPTVVPSGPTASRPSGPAEGTQYFDTDINVALIFERSQWRTLAGSPGDVKFVKAADIGTALTKNPGWAQDTDSLGRVVGAAGSGVGLTERAYGDSVGAEEVSIEITQMAEHQHSFVNAGSRPRWSADGNVANAAGNLVGYAAETEQLVSSNPPTGEGGLPHNNMQPTIFYWALVKL